jgi:hypothetical protein
LSGTSVAQIEPNRNKNNENMILEKSWYEYYITKFVGIPYNHVIILYFSNTATLIIKKLKPYLASLNGLCGIGQ